MRQHRRLIDTYTPSRRGVSRPLDASTRPRGGGIRPRAVQPAVLPYRLPLGGPHPLHEQRREEQQADQVAAEPRGCPPAVRWSEQRAGPQSRRAPVYQSAAISSCSCMIDSPEQGVERQREEHQQHPERVRQPGRAVGPRRSAARTTGSRPAGSAGACSSCSQGCSQGRLVPARRSTARTGWRRTARQPPAGKVSTRADPAVQHGEHAPAAAGRQRPQRQRDRRAERQEDRRDHREQHVLDHVDGEQRRVVGASGDARDQRWLPRPPPRKATSAPAARRSPRARSRRTPYR